jgi:hypothetical protein
MRESPLARNQAGALGLRHTHPRVIGILLIAPDARDRNYFDSQSHKSRPCPSLKSPEPDPQNVLLLDENEKLGNSSVRDGPRSICRIVACPGAVRHDSHRRAGLRCRAAATATQAAVYVSDSLVNNDLVRPHHLVVFVFEHVTVPNVFAGIAFEFHDEPRDHVRMRADGVLPPGFGGFWRL